MCVWAETGFHDKIQLFMLKRYSQKNVTRPELDHVPLHFTHLIKTHYNFFPIYFNKAHIGIFVSFSIIEYHFILIQVGCPFEYGKCA